MRDSVRAALYQLAARFSPDAFFVDEAKLEGRYKTLYAWPADAEMALRLLAWLLGAGFSNPLLKSAVERDVPDFDLAAQAVTLDDAGGVTLALGAIARAGFRNAAVVVRRDLDPEILYWPTDLSRYEPKEPKDPT